MEFNRKMFENSGSKRRMVLTPHIFVSQRQKSQFGFSVVWHLAEPGPHHKLHGMSAVWERVRGLDKGTFKTISEGFSLFRNQRESSRGRNSQPESMLPTRAEGLCPRSRQWGYSNYFYLEGCQ